MPTERGRPTYRPSTESRLRSQLGKVSQHNDDEGREALLRRRHAVVMIACKASMKWEWGRDRDAWMRYGIDGKEMGSATWFPGIYIVHDMTMRTTKNGNDAVKSNTHCVHSVQSSMESAVRQMGHTRAVRSQRRRHTSWNLQRNALCQHCKSDSESSPIWCAMHDAQTKGRNEATLTYACTQASVPPAPPS